MGNHRRLLAVLACALERLSIVRVKAIFEEKGQTRETGKEAMARI